MRTARFGLVYAVTHVTDLGSHWEKSGEISIDMDHVVACSPIPGAQFTNVLLPGHSMILDIEYKAFMAQWKRIGA